MALFLGIPVAYWAIGALGAGTAGQIWWSSPAGAPARRATERALTDAFSRTRSRTCDNCEPCPVCSQGTNPTPGRTPQYVLDNRRPIDSETILAGYAPTNEPMVKGASVYQLPGGGFVHRDTKRVGRAAELETYDRSRRHTGTICPHCGRPRSGPVPNRRLYD